MGFDGQVLCPLVVVKGSCVFFLTIIEFWQAMAWYYWSHQSRRWHSSVWL